jgi:hypothetical protein
LRRRIASVWSTKGKTVERAATQPLTPEQALLMQSREWRLGSLYRIVDEQGISVPFRPNDVQRALWDELWFWNLILKGRQHGISTFICLLMLDSCLFASNTHCGLIDATLADATKKLDKVRFAYEHLPSEIKAFVPIRADNATCLEWKNGSRIDVGTSHRGGTLQILHVSEMGKIAAEAPARSREIRTGAFGTVHAGQTVFVESTAAGAAGDFFDLVQEADAVRRLGRPLSPHEFKLIFLPWQLRQQYRADPATVLITKELADYFGDLEHNHGIKLDAEQRAWYAVTQKKIGPDSMLKEYPSYPEEAFKVSIEGAYFKPQRPKCARSAVSASYPSIRRVRSIPFGTSASPTTPPFGSTRTKGKCTTWWIITKTTARASSIMPASCVRKPPKEVGPMTNTMGLTTSTTATGYCQAASEFRMWPGTWGSISSSSRAFTTSRTQ